MIVKTANYLLLLFLAVLPFPRWEWCLSGKQQLLCYSWCQILRTESHFYRKLMFPEIKNKEIKSLTFANITKVCTKWSKCLKSDLNAKVTQLPKLQVIVHFQTFIAKIAPPCGYTRYTWFYNWSEQVSDVNGRVWWSINDSSLMKY